MKNNNLEEKSISHNRELNRGSIRKRNFKLWTLLILSIILSAVIILNLSSALSNKESYLDKKARRILLSTIGVATENVKQDYKLSQEDLSNLTKPTVVRILKKMNGEIRIPEFDIDWENLDIIKDDKSDPLIIPVKNDYSSGSGFIVNPNGYILTNSHVVSKEEIKNRIVSEIALRSIMLSGMKFASENPVKADEFDKNISEEQQEEFGKKIKKFIYDITEFDLDHKIVVISPSSSGVKMDDLFNDGFNAEVISVNDKYDEDNKDIALIKIGQSNLPAIKLRATSDVSIGNQVYITGFPGNADFSDKNFMESSFTKGSISAIRDSKNKDFKIFQTDAKISEGSSGSPLFDENGLVLGVITYQTGDLSEGDNFNFAIPAEIATNILKEKSIENTEGRFNQHFRNGLSLMADSHCKKAVSEFESALDTNKLFDVSKNVNPYIDKCNAMISSGDSIDSSVEQFWNEAKSKFKKVDVANWTFSIVEGIILLGLIVAVIFLVKRLKRDELEIHKLEEGVNGTSLNGSASGSSQVDSLKQYILSMRQAGSNDDAIKEELRKAGWSDEDIQKSL